MKRVRIGKWTVRASVALTFLLVGIGGHGMKYLYADPDWPFGLFLAGVAMLFVTFALIGIEAGSSAKRAIGSSVGIAGGAFMVFGLCGLVVEFGIATIAMSIVGATVFAAGLLMVKTSKLMADEEGVEQRDGEVSSESALSDELSS